MPSSAKKGSRRVRDTMTEKKPLARKNHKTIESMQRYLSAIDNNLYAAEQVCHLETKVDANCPSDCPFLRTTTMFSTINYQRCILPHLRGILGYRVKQDDPTTDAYIGPCVWLAGSHNGMVSKVCLFTGRKGCPEMIMVGSVRTCGRVHD